jgi:hypothetical protein
MKITGEYWRKRDCVLPPRGRAPSVIGANEWEITKRKNEAIIDEVTP